MHLAGTHGEHELGRLEEGEGEEGRGWRKEEGWGGGGGGGEGGGERRRKGNRGKKRGGGDSNEIYDLDVVQ